MYRIFNLLAVVTFLSGLAMHARADAQHFSHSFNMYGNYQEYLSSTTNVQVWSEPWGGGATYWSPVQTGTPATVEYHFPLSFRATSGTLTACLYAYTSGSPWGNYDNNAYAYLDVSPDGQNWTNIDGRYPGYGGIGGWDPYDISSVIAGSSDVWVRCRLFDSVKLQSFSAAQFLRTGAELPTTWNSFDLEVNAVPEASTITLLCAGAIGLLACGWRKWRMKREACIVAVFGVACFGGVAGVNAATFNYSFNLYDDYTQYLYSTENASVLQEGPTVIYWRAPILNQWGQVVYRFPLQFQVDAASLTADIAAYFGSGPYTDPLSQTHLDVSADGSTWSNVASVTAWANPGQYFDQHDISPMVHGANEVWVRARMFSTFAWPPPEGFYLSQFMRSDPSDPVLPVANGGNPEFVFTATGTVPEPSSMALLVTAAIGLLAYGWRKWRSR